MEPIQKQVRGVSNLESNTRIATTSDVYSAFPINDTRQIRPFSLSNVLEVLQFTSHHDIYAVPAWGLENRTVNWELLSNVVSAYISTPSVLMSVHVTATRPSRCTTTQVSSSCPTCTVN